ncbi:hypothetical protein JTB14_003245 [Gonioctena quinquepunctata]|nr:hypothetical protein JTB14_003245 [Gonioctena quinquepunctata]
MYCHHDISAFGVCKLSLVSYLATQNEKEMFHSLVQNSVIFMCMGHSIYTYCILLGLLHSNIANTDIYERSYGVPDEVECLIERASTAAEMGINIRFQLYSRSNHQQKDL